MFKSLAGLRKARYVPEKDSSLPFLVLFDPLGELYGLFGRPKLDVRLAEVPVHLFDGADLSHHLALELLSVDDLQRGDLAGRSFPPDRDQTTHVRVVQADDDCFVKRQRPGLARFLDGGRDPSGFLDKGRTNRLALGFIDRPVRILCDDPCDRPETGREKNQRKDRRCRRP